MTSDEAIKTSAFMCRLDDEFVMMQEYLDRLGFNDDCAGEFKIFCGTQSAVDYFGYPKKTSYKGMEVVVVSKYPSLVANVVRSTEFVVTPES